MIVAADGKLDPLDTLIRVLVFVIGALGILMFYRSILRVAVLHIRQRDWIATQTGRIARAPVLYLARRQRNYEDVQKTMVWAFPVHILFLIAVYFIWVQVSFMLLLWAVEIDRSWLKNFIISGSALSTLGFSTPASAAGQLFAILEGAFGLGIIVFMFTFLPGYRAAVQNREDLVGWIFARVGERPTAFSLIDWSQKTDQLQDPGPIFERAESWFRALQETHLLTPSLAFVPAVRTRRTWVGAATCMLDAASFALSSLDVKGVQLARTCHDTGVEALNLVARELSDETGVVAVEAVKGDGDDLAEAYNATYDRLAAAGLPMRPNRDECRLAFMSLRAEYMRAVRELAAATLMPTDEPWVLPWATPRPTATSAH